MEHNTSASATRTKPPRSDCKSAKRWRDYYQAKAAEFDDSANVIARTMGEENISVAYCRRESEKFRQGAVKIERGEHPMILSGKWK